MIAHHDVLTRAGHIGRAFNEERTETMMRRYYERRWALSSDEYAGGLPGDPGFDPQAGLATPQATNEETEQKEQTETTNEEEKTIEVAKAAPDKGAPPGPKTSSPPPGGSNVPAAPTNCAQGTSPFAFGGGLSIEAPGFRISIGGGYSGCKDSGSGGDKPRSDGGGDGETLIG
jgi:hypothetical protein